MKIYIYLLNCTWHMVLLLASVLYYDRDRTQILLPKYPKVNPSNDLKVKEKKP